MYKKLNVIFFILALACQAFFYGQAVPARAEAAPAVIINEIAWMGTVVSANDEWMELYNAGNEDIDLDGWTLTAADGTPAIELAGVISAGGYFLLERTDDETVPGVSADLIYTGVLGNAGEVLELKDGSGAVIDRVDMAGGWDAGDNVTKQTMERKEGGGWQTSADPGGTPKAENSGSAPGPAASVCGNGIVEAGEECDDGNTAAGDGCSPVCAAEPVGDEEESATGTPDTVDGEEEDGQEAPPAAAPVSFTKLGAVVINEFVSDPADGDTEWVEIFNTTEKEVDLAGWIVEEGSGAKTALTGRLGASGADRFFVVAEPKGNLNNKGDIIILRDAGGVLVDQVAYGNWDDGRTDDNAPVTGDPYSVARKIDGYNSYNNANDFIVTLTPTKGAANKITGAEAEEGASGEAGAAARAEYDYSDDIFISEIFPDPPGSDTEAEFIELHNRGNRDVDLSGWRLGDESSRRYEIKNKSKSGDPRNTIIKTGGYFVVYRQESRIALNNNGDSVKLYLPLEDEPIREVKYGKATEGWSYNLAESGSMNNYEWSETVTPGAANVIKAVNHPPVVDFSFPAGIRAGVPVIFDSSDTIDEDGDGLAYLWDFGDGIELTLASPEHMFLAAGSYAVRLTVSDGEHEAVKEKIVPVLSADGSGGNTSVLGWQGEAGASRIIVNEFMPDPEGSDEAEWIELYNNGETAVNLYNWRLDDEEGGSRPFTFKEAFWLEAGEYLLVSRAESGIALNNGGDQVRLFYGSGELAEEIGYGKAIEGMSYARGLDNKWYWTAMPTPGRPNIILGTNSGTVAAKSTSKTGGTTVKKIAAAYYVDTTLEEIKNFDVGDLVKVRGAVAVLPGILGSQYFYITGSPGIQVYSYKKDFPELAVGDLIEVSGELGESGGERRLKTKTAADITVIGHGEPLAPEEVSCAAIGDELVGRLVSLTGEVVKKSGSTIFLDDGTDETTVYLKKTAGIGTGGVKVGETITVIGLVGRTTSGTRVMPRSSDDIIVAGGEDVRVLGVVSEDEWTLAARDRKTELFKYLLILAGGAIVVLGGALVKMRKR